MKHLLYYATLLCTLAGHPFAWSVEPEILTLSSAEDAGGVTQTDLDIPALKMLERRSVESLESKMRTYLAGQGQSAQMPKLHAQSNYVETNGVRLAVVRIQSPATLNQVFIYGIKGEAFLRVACLRTVNFDRAISLFHGPCSEKLREVFGIGLTIN